MADAELRGRKYLEKYSTPFVYTTLQIKSNTDLGLSVGQTIRVIDNKSSKIADTNLVINRLRMRYPADYDEVDIGDKLWRLAEWQSNIEEKFKRLQEEELQNQDIVVELVDIDNTVNNYVSPTPRWFKVRYQNMGGDTLIWGNPAFGTWGSFKWGSTVTNSGFILGT